ncbi:26S proteasome-like protein regulatory subunit rpn12 [Dipodascopsis tothii]|uniref:26S proteasome-like protein regulatory subunit rpn12 n=1 Tax=Dipodascopsis tothii TaxID=44089 RepID=UPI0034CE3FF9
MPAAKATTFAQVESKVKALEGAFAAKDYEQCVEALGALKIALAQQNLLVPGAGADTKKLVVARRVLEIGALTSIFVLDEVMFSRYLSQLSAFYALAGLPASENEKKLVALKLLLLLSKNDIAEFHTELETLEDEAETDPYIRYPVMLERWLMEGSYDRVWKATTQRSEVPAEEFAIFADILVNTIRTEIAKCSEKAYPSLPVSNAKHLLFFTDDAEAREFIAERGWTIRGNRIYFPQAEPEVSEAGLATEKVIENAIGYARELETII